MEKVRFESGLEDRMSDA